MRVLGQRWCSLLLAALACACSSSPALAPADHDGPADAVTKQDTSDILESDILEIAADEQDEAVDTAPDATPLADTVTTDAAADAAEGVTDVADAPDLLDASDIGDMVAMVDSEDASQLDQVTDEIADTAADIAADATSPVGLPPATLGFVATMAGKFAVVDLQKLTMLAEIGQGHQHVHGMGVAPGQKTVFVPNADDGSIDRYEQVGGPTKWAITATWPTGIKMGMLDATPDGKFLAMTAGNMVIKMPDGGMPNFSKDIVIFDTSLGQPIAKLQTVSPNPIAIASDGATAWVGNWLNHTISKINVGTSAESASIALPTAGADPNWVGPTRVTLSPDENWLLSCDLGDKVAVLMPTANPTQQIVVPVGQLAHWCEFAPDSKTFAVTTWDHLIDQGDEMANTTIPSATLVFDRATQKQLAKLTWKFLMVHNGFAPGTPWLFVTASYGNVLRYDASYQLTGQLPVAMGGEPMPAMTISF